MHPATSTPTLSLAFRFGRASRSPRERHPASRGSIGSTLIAAFLTSALLVPASAFGSSSFVVTQRPTASDHVPGEGVVTSADGRYLAFRSRSTRIVLGQKDSNSWEDVFLLDRETGVTTLVSHALGDPLRAGNWPSATGTVAYDNVYEAVTISDDGRYVAFSSLASNLTADDDQENTADVFVYDRQTGDVRLVSRSAVDPTRTADGASTVPRLSADGSALIFHSTASDLVSGQTGDDAQGLFHYTLATEETRLVSRHHADPAAKVGEVEQSAIRADGTQVVFTSDGTDHVNGVDTNESDDVFLYSLPAGTVELVSHAAGDPTTAANDLVSRLVGIADDGSIAFSSHATDLLAGVTDDNVQVDLFHVAADGTVTLISHAFGDPTTTGNRESNFASMSADGTVLAFQSDASDLVDGTDTNNRFDVFLYRLADGFARLLSRRHDEPSVAGDDHSLLPEISRDGNLVIFDSRAEDLVANDTNGFLDVFVHKVVTNETTAVSRKAGNPQTTGNSLSEARGNNGYQIPDPVLSADGASVFFSSSSDDLNASWLLNNSFETTYEHTFATGVSRPAIPSALGHRVWSASRSGPTALSDDGRFLAFVADPKDLLPDVPVELEQVEQVFLFDRVTGILKLVSHALGDPSMPSVDIDAFEVKLDISADGRFVVFNSSSAALVSGTDSNDQDDVFLYDRTTEGLTLVSHALGSLDTASNGRSDRAVLSGDGNSVIYVGFGTDLTVEGIPSIFHYDRLTGTNTRIPSVTSNYSASFDGSRVVGIATDIHAQDTNNLRDVYLWNRDGGSTTWISQGLGGVPGNGHASSPSISSDGNTVIFTSQASNLDVTDANGEPDVFLVDLLTAQRSLVSHEVGDPTTTADEGGSSAILSADGSRVIFQSASTNLVTVPADTGDRENVFFYDKASGVNTLLTVPQIAEVDVGAESRPAAVSSDGSFVLVTSAAQDLLPGLEAPGQEPPFDFSMHLFRYEIGTSEPELVDRPWFAGPSTAAFYGAEDAIISGDGSYIAFSSPAASLVPGDERAFDDIFLHGPDLEVDLSLSVTPPASPVPVGTPMSFTVGLTRSVAAVAPALHVALSLTAGSTFSGATGDGWTCRANEVAVLCDHAAVEIGLPLPGLEITILPPAAGGRLDYTVAASAAAVDLSTADNRSTHSIAVTGGDWIFSDGFESGGTGVWPVSD